jgi:hypothetical protein
MELINDRDHWQALVLMVVFFIIIANSIQSVHDELNNLERYGLILIVFVSMNIFIIMCCIQFLDETPETAHLRNLVVNGRTVLQWFGRRV